MEWSDYKKLATKDLLEYIKWRGSGDSELEEAAHKAFLAFYYRFIEDVTKKCEILCSNRGHDESVALIIIERVFIKIKEKHNYDHSKSTAEDFDTGVLLYLYSIAYYQLIDYYREQTGYGASRYTGDETIVKDIDDLTIFSSGSKSNSQLKVLHEILSHALSGFSEKKVMIYLTYINAGVQEGEKPPRHLSKLLREATGLCQQSVKLYNNEVREKVKIIKDVYAKEK